MEKLHAWYQKINTNKLKPSEVFVILANILNIDNKTKLYKAGFHIAKQADTDITAAYHNYIHTSETMATMFELAKIELEEIELTQLKTLGLQNKSELILIAIITMAGHDILHDGLADQIISPDISAEDKFLHANRLEIQSANCVKHICEKLQVPQKVTEIMTNAILGTAVKNHQLYEKNRTNYKNNHSSIQNIITQLATEADLAASISHVYGPAKSQLLAKEIADAGNELLAKNLMNVEGRLWFLNNACHLLSKGSKETGLLTESKNETLQRESFERFIASPESMYHV